jgi:hypothetical protein
MQPTNPLQVVEEPLVSQAVSWREEQLHGADYKRTRRDGMDGGGKGYNVIYLRPHTQRNSELRQAYCR